MTLAREAFERALRRLDGAEARAFVADLLGARGYRTTVDGSVVTATDGPAGSIRLFVVADWRTLTDARDDRPVDVVVITGGAVVATAGSFVVRRVDGNVRPVVRGPELLYEWFAFAVDSEARARLTDRYLGATERTVAGRAWRGLAAARPVAVARSGRRPIPTGRIAVVVLVAMFVVVAAATAGPLAALDPGVPTQATTDGDVAGGTPELTSVPLPRTSAPTTTDPGPPLPDVCPSPPVDAHPASLRPGVIRTASASGLEGWDLLITQNLTEYQFDPNDQQSGSVPEVRHIAVYEIPEKVQFRLGLDRWQSPAMARTAIDRGGAWMLGFPWGHYAVWVEWQHRGVDVEPSARELLAAVRTPGGVKLGGACVSTLLTGSTTNGTNGTT